MIAQFIERLLSETHAWDSYLDILAGLPDNF